MPALRAIGRSVQADRDRSARILTEKVRIGQGLRDQRVEGGRGLPGPRKLAAGP
jgi:hypothetical protein